MLVSVGHGVFQQRDGDLWDKVIKGKLANCVGPWRVVVVTNDNPEEGMGRS